MTDCIWRTIAINDGLHTYVCPKCRRIVKSRYEPNLVHRNCSTVLKEKEFGPGTELQKMLEFFGGKVTRYCGCKDWVSWMNNLGPDCERHIEDIVARLQEEARKRSPWKWLLTKWAARCLVRRAIRRAV